MTCVLVFIVDCLLLSKGSTIPRTQADRRRASLGSRPVWFPLGCLLCAGSLRVCILKMVGEPKSVSLEAGPLPDAEGPGAHGRANVPWIDVHAWLSDSLKFQQVYRSPRSAGPAKRHGRLGFAYNDGVP